MTDLLAIQEQDLVGLVAQALPSGSGVRLLLRGPVTLEQEPRLVGDLCFRRLRPEVPDDRGEDVRARAQERRQVHRLVAPVEEVAASGTGGDARAVGVELVAIVGRDVDHERRRHRVDSEPPPKVVDAVAGRRRVGHGDPPRGPRAHGGEHRRKVG